MSKIGLVNVFVVKYNESGNVIWAKTATGGSVEVRSISVNSLKEVYLTGDFFGQNNLSIGTTILTNTGNYDIFIAKIDSNGNAIWAKGAGGTGIEYSWASITNSSGNMFITGWFASNIINFDTSSIINADNTGSTYDIFIAKLNVFTVSTSNTNVHCHGENNGTATAFAIGGGAYPYTYLWNTVPQQTSQTATGLASGTYSVTITDYYGSTATNSVIISEPTLVLINNLQTICNGESYIFNGHTYTDSGNYNDTLSTVYGCDSIIITQLNVNPISQTPVITQNGNTLNSNIISGNQWNDDNGIINGETGQVFTPIITGHYFSIVTDSNGCISDTSNIIYVVFTGMSNLTDNDKIYIYPTLAENSITIETQQPTTLEIISIEGKIIKKMKIKDKKMRIDISNFPSGVYIITDKTGSGITTKKFIKE